MVSGIVCVRSRPASSEVFHERGVKGNRWKAKCTAGTPKSDLGQPA